jgi:hypothetical protein
MASYSSLLRGHSASHLLLVLVLVVCVHCVLGCACHHPAPSWLLYLHNAKAGGVSSQK